MAFAPWCCAVAASATEKVCRDDKACWSGDAEEGGLSKLRVVQSRFPPAEAIPEDIPLGRSPVSKIIDASFDAIHAATPMKILEHTPEEEEEWARQQSFFERQSQEHMLRMRHLTLQKMVKDFIQAAKQGIACRMMTASSKQVLPAAYCVNWLDRRFRVQSLLSSVESFEERISGVREVLDLEDGQVYFNTEDLEPFRGELWAATAVVVLHGGQCPIALVHKDTAKRDRFVTCMKILRLFVEADRLPRGLVDSSAHARQFRAEVAL
mmetsp:Transcript_17270/g.40213  ORF Transcript_17270/g.40213 Transcript_17270/m.40213 type:complete len:266 (+) Transcript_17270:71-868(+)